MRGGRWDSWARSSVRAQLSHRLPHPPPTDSGYRRPPPAQTSGTTRTVTIKLLERPNDTAQAQNAPVVAISAKIESELADMDEADKLVFLQEMGQEEPGLNRLIRAAFKLLGLQTYFTAGVKEVRAWTVPIGATGPQAAGVIHTDFERGFIRAEVIAFADYIKYRGEAGARDAGRLRLEGKEYLVHEGDVMHFRFNV